MALAPPVNVGSVLVIHEKSPPEDLSTLAFYLKGIHIPEGMCSQAERFGDPAHVR
jgi:hypothetical protein